MTPAQAARQKLARRRRDRRAKADRPYTVGDLLDAFADAGPDVRRMRVESADVGPHATFEIHHEEQVVLLL